VQQSIPCIVVTVAHNSFSSRRWCASQGARQRRFIFICRLEFVDIKFANSKNPSNPNL